VVNGYLDELAYDNGAVVQVQVDTGQIAVAYPYHPGGKPFDAQTICWGVEVLSMGRGSAPSQQWRQPPIV
jgi:hypothetical protein